MKRLLITLTALLVTISLSAKVNFEKMDREKIVSSPDLKWTQFGPGGSGNNYYIFAHPTDAKTFYQGPNMGNAYRTTDGGVTYEGVLDYDGTSGRSLSRGPAEISALDFSRQNPDFALCSCENFPYLFVSNDRGLSWERDERSSDLFQLNENGISSIKVDPNDENIWYVGAGHIKDANRYLFTEAKPHGYYQAGKGKEIAAIWRSSNRGRSWQTITPAGLPTDAQITEIFIHPAKSNRIFAATTYGLYVSDNGGKKWTLRDKCGLDNDIIRSMDMHYDPSTKKVTFVAVDLVKYIPDGESISYNGGVFRSVDEGRSWKNINSDLPVDEQLLKGRIVNNGYYSLTLSKWFKCSVAEVKERFPLLPKKILHSFSVVKINPTNVNEYMLVNNYKSQFTFPGGMLWRTQDGGNHWIATLRNGKRWETTDMEYWQSRNNPTSHNVTLKAQKEWELRDDYERKAGATITYSCDGKMIMFQFAKVVCVSTDGGDTWIENDEEDVSRDNSEYWMGGGNSNMPGSEIVQDERIKDHFYLCAGENSIWQTTPEAEQKYGVARQSVKKLLFPNAAKAVECSVGSMAVDPRDVNTIYSTHYRQAFMGKLMKSVDGGANWKIQGKLFDVPKAEYHSAHLHQNHLTIDPKNPERFYVCIPRKTIDDAAGQGGTKFFREYGVYRSVDGGVTFERVVDGLSNTDIQMIALSPTEDGVLYCAVMSMGNKAGGLFRLESGADSWSRVTTPNNMTSVHDIFFAQDGKMYISGGTFEGKNRDGGVWCSEDMKSWNQVFPYKITNHIRVAKYDPKVLLVSVPGSARNSVKNPGIYRSLDGGESWEKVNFGNIQSDRLSDLQIDYFREGIYWCSTYGAGYYKGADKNLIK